MADVYKADVYRGTSVTDPLLVYVTKGLIRTIDGVEYVETVSGYLQLRCDRWLSTEQDARLEACEIIVKAAKVLADQATRLARGEK